MVKINYGNIELEHLVKFTKDNTIFAAGRDSSNGKMRIFLVYEDTGNVYTRNGAADSWEELYAADRENIISRVRGARGDIPTYKINSAHN